MKVLFVNVTRKKYIQTHYYPLAFGYLVSYCERFGKKFEYSYAERLDKTVLQNFQPNVIALTSVSENYNLARQYAQLAKKTDNKIKVVIGGVHISAIPNSLDKNMDVGVVGEGEQTFLELLRNNFDVNDKIKGIVYHDGDVLCQTEQRPLVKPLDAIPHPNRGMFRGIREQYLFTSRGCPYKCVFCFSSRFWKEVRFHSPRYVAEEIRQINRQFQSSHLRIYDDTFVLDTERVEQIKDLVKDLKLTYSIQARANLITEELVKILKEMKVVTVGIGFESHAPKVLEYLQKGNTPEDNQRAVDILRKHKIRVHGSFIRDVPIETKQDLKTTHNFIRQNNIPYDMYRLRGYPVTPIYHGSEDWDSFAVYRYVPMTVRIKEFLVRTKRLLRTTQTAYS